MNMESYELSSLPQSFNYLVFFLLVFLLVFSIFSEEVKSALKSQDSSSFILAQKFTRLSGIEIYCIVSLQTHFLCLQDTRSRFLRAFGPNIITRRSSSQVLHRI